MERQVLKIAAERASALAAEQVSMTLLNDPAKVEEDIVRENGRGHENGIHAV